MSADTMGSAYPDLAIYQRLGWSLIEVIPGTKKPREEDWPNRGSRDLEAWARWLSRGSNIGLLTGRASGVWVLDVDPRHGGDDSLAGLEREHGKLPETVESLTPSGGRHLYFGFHPGGPDIRNKVGIRPGLDIRGTGGQVLIPPSRIGSQPYIWEESSRPDQIGFASYVLNSGTERSNKASAARPILEGHRNDSLFRLGCWLRNKGLTESSILATLLQENGDRCSPPLSADEVERIAQSAARYSSGDDYDRDERVSIQNENKTVPTTNPLIMDRGTGLDLFNADLPEESAIVPGFLYPQGVSQMTAEGGTGKTFLAFQLAAALCSESVTEWLGLSVPGARNVGYLGAEGTAKRYQERLRIIAQHFGMEWLSRFHPRTPRWGGRSIWDIPGDADVRKWIMEWIRHSKLEVLIADPFTSMKSGDLEENSGSDMSLVTAAFAEIRDATGAAMVLLHHPPYNRQGGRASVVLRNVLDAEIYLEGQGEREAWQAPGGMVRVRWVKPDRYGICPKPRTLERQPNGLLLETEGRAATSTEHLVLKLVTEAVLLTELVTRMAAADHPISREGLRKVVERLHRRGRLQYDVPQGKAAIVRPSSNTYNSGVSSQLEEATRESNAAR